MSVSSKIGLNGIYRISSSSSESCLEHATRDVKEVIFLQSRNEMLWRFRREISIQPVQSAGKLIWIEYATSSSVRPMLRGILSYWFLAESLWALTAGEDQWQTEDQLVKWHSPFTPKHILYCTYYTQRLTHTIQKGKPCSFHTVLEQTACAVLKGAATYSSECPHTHTHTDSYRQK